MSVEELLSLLACPACGADLELLKDNGAPAAFACQACQLAYPIVDEIPLMLLEEAVPLGQWEAGQRRKG